MPEIKSKYREIEKKKPLSSTFHPVHAQLRELSRDILDECSKLDYAALEALRAMRDGDNESAREFLEEAYLGVYED